MNWVELIASRVSSYNRTRKFAYFMEVLKPSPQTKLLDVGFSNQEGTYNSMINYIEKHYPYPQNITALGVDGKDLFEQHYPKVRAVLYDGSLFPFADKSFDIGWSNAVIEHVGDHERQVLFIRELCRTCRIVYFTTPNRLFPIELHTKLPLLHWFPASLFDRIVVKLGMPWATKKQINLLTKRQILRLCAEAGFPDVRIKRNRLCGITMDFCMIIEPNG